MSSIWKPIGWTCVGTAFVADERSVGKYEASAARFRHKDSITGNIVARGNVTNPRDDGGDPNWNCLEVVYRRQSDTDQVTAKLVRVSNETGGVYTLATLDGNNFPTSNDEQTQSVGFHHDFDFRRFAYFVQIEVDRTSSAEGHTPSVSVARLMEVRECIDWEIRLERLRVERTNESRDEPYFAMLGFRSTFDTPGSTSVFWSGALDDKWAENSEAGDEHDIPREMGVVTFPNVCYVPFLDLLGGSNPEVIGALAVAFESDTTPWSIMRAIIEEIRTALGIEVRRLVEERPVSVDFDDEDIAEAISNIKRRLDFHWTVDLAIAAASAYDIDDMIDIHTFIFVPIDPMPELGFPALTIEEDSHVGALMEHQFTLQMANAIRFAGDDAVYLVNAAVDALLRD